MAVWGSRGSGKTTLLQLAAGLLAPDGGTVSLRAWIWRGCLVGSVRGCCWRRSVGRSVGGRGTRGSRCSITWRCRCWGVAARGVRGRGGGQALTRVGLQGCASKNWSRLTDGERTLVSIAHALVRGPKLLVVDDPTANLDMIEREQIMELLRSAAEDGGIGVLVTVPDMSEMLHAHRIASLSNGRLLVPRTPAGDGGEVIDFPGRLSA